MALRGMSFGALVAFVALVQGSVTTTSVTRAM
jgi:hypothetical protein